MNNTMQQATSENGNTPGDEREDYVYLSDLLMVAWRYRWLIAGVFTVALTGAVVFCRLATPIYKVEASILSYTQVYTEQKGVRENVRESRRNKIVLKNILESFSLREQVARKEGMAALLFPGKWDEKTKKWRDDIKKPPTPQDGARRLGEWVEIAETDKKNNLKLVIRVTHHDPELARLVANTYIDVLDLFLKQKTFSVVKRNRLFLEDQLKRSRAKLDALEGEMESFQKQYRIYDLDKQAQATIAIYNDTIKVLFEKKTRLEVLLDYTSPLNPRVVQLKKEIRVLEKKISELKNRGAAEPAPGMVKDDDSEESHLHRLIPVDLLPRLKMRHARLKKEIDIQKKITDLMIESYEKAKIQESREDIYFTVLDRAGLPGRPFWPDKKKILSVAGVLGLSLGILLTFALEFIGRNKKRFRRETIVDRRSSLASPSGRPGRAPRPKERTGK